MYLKALEIQGFKSFPDKIRLPFEKDMTAIVGPNGSGKSNIADAVSWVMGEQSSKNLRGQKMEDVIFGGTGQRGPAAFAQVSLVFDNTAGIFKAEGDETLITRRYYRSGDSEYYINKKLVRLKDVNELLMDTGLGRDGYSIIGQGKVDSILSAKSTDRREIFEEAAGISKFRYRKEEAQRKVEKTEESLLRIGDKISELELQLEPLKRQAETAKKYLILRDELRGLEISVWMDSLDKLQVRTLRLDSEYTQLGESLESAREQLEQLYSNTEEFTEGMRQADVRADAERERIAADDSAAAAAENEASLIEAEI
ncbi:MAG: AAA family ATPase, partial [Oscillospiraceae bacterium]|nr:AAA family ATPase [Oscillospiraceae bacterium]